jgi:hypothetical protein
MKNTDEWIEALAARESKIKELEADVAALNDGWEATKAELEIERRPPVAAMMTVSNYQAGLMA